MERHEEYKDSHIPWVGEVPAHWEVRKLKTLVSRKSETGKPDGTVLSLYRDYGVIPKDSRSDNHNRTSENTDSYRVVGIDDLVVNKMKAWQGSLAVSQYDGIVSPAYFVYRLTSSKIFPRYLHYATRNASYIPEYKRLSGGIRPDQWDLSPDGFSQILYLVPPYEEQVRISEYLDRILDEIDALIEATVKSIELLEEYRRSVISEAVTKGLDPNAPMKDSGIEWVGEIPVHWAVEALGLRSTMLTPMRDKPEDLDGPIPWVRIEDYDGKHLSCSKAGYGVSQETIDEMNLKVYPVGTVLCTSSCDLGKAAIIAEPLVSNQRFIGIIPGKDLTSDFLYYLMLSNSERLNTLSTGTIQANLSRKSFEHLKLPFPSIEEQTQISRFLDQQTSAIDELITSRKEIVSLLSDYRRSLISEAVTGKIKVPGVK
uniref:Restriction endonuclease subunit S n=1 Tax=Muribaculaceae bacterium Z82 TaxID=2304548 RepID=A0A7C9NCT9_9BACT